MFTEQKVELRKIILNQLAIGKTITVSTQGSTALEVIDFVKRYIKSKRREATIVPGDGFITITEIEPNSMKRPPGRPALAPEKLKYPLAALEIGDSVLVEVPKTEYTKVRNSAAARASSQGWKLSCNSQPGGIRVTRTA